MIAGDLPLFELFTQLRQVGLPLGIDDYYLLLRALQAGFGLPDQDALKRLCKMLWIKSPEDASLFDHQFEYVMARSDRSRHAFSSGQALPGQKKTRGDSISPASDTESGIPQPSPSEIAGMTTKIKDEVQAFQAVPPPDRREENISHKRIIQSDEYFPITRRQMKQSWRYLRQPVREGPPTELDVEATINEIGRQGVFFEPVLVPLRVNRAKILLLVDQGGSMIPFHALANRLVETASHGGHLGNTGVYYFHDCPTEYLYRSPARLGAVPIQDALNQFRSDRAGVLIFSDAGAARGSYSPERATLTKRFLDGLKQHIRYIAWLNPMPRARWGETTAEEIMHVVPMFDVSRRGMDNAISVLRGHPLHLEASKP